MTIEETVNTPYKYPTGIDDDSEKEEASVEVNEPDIKMTQTGKIRIMRK